MLDYRECSRKLVRHNFQLVIHRKLDMCSVTEWKISHCTRTDVPKLSH